MLGLALVAPMAVSLHLWPGKGHLRNTPLCENASAVSKHNSEIWAKSRGYYTFGGNLENPVNYLGN